MSEYSSIKYWNDRYSIDLLPFEWLQPFSSLRRFISPLIYPPLQTFTPFKDIPISSSSASLSLLMPSFTQINQRAINPTIQKRQRSSSVIVTSDSHPHSHSHSNPHPHPFPLTNHESHSRSHHHHHADLLLTNGNSPIKKVLVIGCGTSQCSYDIWCMGKKDDKVVDDSRDDRQSLIDVVSIDFSPVVIDEMKKRYQQYRGMTWHVMDVRHLDFPSSFFDVIVDKGTLDCLHCGEGNTHDNHQHDDVSHVSVTDVGDKGVDGGVDPIRSGQLRGGRGGSCLNEDNDVDITRAVAELERVTKPGGHLVSLSHSPPHQRSHHFLVTESQYLKAQLDNDRKQREIIKEYRRSIIGGLQLQRAKREKEKEREGEGNRGGEEGGRDNVSLLLGSAKLPTTASSSTPLSSFTRPIVHRIPKLPEPVFIERDRNRSSISINTTNTNTNTSNSNSDSNNLNTNIHIGRRISLLLQPQLSSVCVTDDDSANSALSHRNVKGSESKKNEVDDADDADDDTTSSLIADDDLAHYSESDHYLYIVVKTTISDPSPVMGMGMGGAASAGKGKFQHVRRSSLALPHLSHTHTHS